MQHWSLRSGFDRRTSLWGGFAVHAGVHAFYFAGDTGYCPAFAEVGSRLGPFDLAAIPVGAYAPTWLMAPQHVTPQEAVRIHGDIRSRSIGVHCCTFSLTDEPLDEPPRLLGEAAAAAGLPPDAFTVLQHGAMLQTAGGVDRNAPRVLGAPAAA
ncbi:hypothetical protein WJX81_000714 [Elliptochloris bilobata]|uniref:Metallo-beta-lactamase domain-containing protein n=1 Tax=Elliptochloris bilobata TaxID=381761 RepID=A0AAW1RIS8_9CHLO